MTNPPNDNQPIDAESKLSIKQFVYKHGDYTIPLQAVFDDLPSLDKEALLAWHRKALQESLERQKPAEFICCPQIQKALGAHKGLYVQATMHHDTEEEDALICYVGGEYTYRKGPIIIQYCPFCGKPRVRRSELQAMLGAESSKDQS